MNKDIEIEELENIVKLIGYQISRNNTKESRLILRKAKALLYECLDLSKEHIIPNESSK